MPVKTNWSIVPANDNDPEDIIDLSFERNLRITPSVEEVRRNFEAGPVTRNEVGQIVGIGRLRFSDGTQTEKAYCYGPEGKLIRYDARLPVGAMMGTRDKAETQAGGVGYSRKAATQSNLYYASILGVHQPRYLPKGTRRNGPGYGREEAANMLREAYVNTKVLPPVKHYPAGLPCGMTNPHEAFVGMRKAKKGESGAIGWEDIASSKIHREVWDATLKEMAAEDVATLDAAMTAKTFDELAPGGKRTAAVMRGVKRLQAANDNLVAIMKKVAA